VPAECPAQALGVGEAVTPGNVSGQKHNFNTANVRLGVNPVQRVAKPVNVVLVVVQVRVGNDGKAELIRRDWSGLGVSFGVCGGGARTRREQEKEWKSHAPA
jgi:hypothetical protein